MTSFIEIPSNLPPANAEAFAFEARDGATLRAGFFPVENAVGGVVLMTGFSEFVEKYFETIASLHARRLGVVMFDWRGQGRSDRKSVMQSQWRGYFDQITDDLERFIEHVARQRLNGPLVLMTHSMGGLAALKLLSQGYDGVERAVLSAPLTRLFPAAAGFFAGLAADGACLAGLSGKPIFARTDDAFQFDGNMFTSDKARHQRFRDLQVTAPDAVVKDPTYGWVRAALHATADLRRPNFFQKMKTPTLIVSAGADRRIDASDHQTIAAASDKIDLRVIDGALHEILVERDEIRDQFFAAFDGFTAPVFGVNEQASSA
ncbi:MAG: alpha/beta hydrolase [Pseudomonadota bacterium]